MPKPRHGKAWRGARKCPLFLFEEAYMQKWEYKVLDAVATPLANVVLNQLGRDGWELVAADGYTFFLKRPLSN
jgi:hypothetical protein